MKNIIIFLVFLNVFILSTQQKNSGTTILPDLVKPRYMAVDNQHVYIVNNYMKGATCGRLYTIDLYSKMQFNSIQKYN